MTQTSEPVPAYTPDHPPVPHSDESQARIPGWGADLNQTQTRRTNRLFPSWSSLRLALIGTSQSVNPTSDRVSGPSSIASCPRVRNRAATQWALGVMRRFAYEFGEGGCGARRVGAA